MSVVVLDERVTQNQSLSETGWELQTHDTDEALSLAEHGHFQNVHVWRQRIVLSVDHNVEGWQSWDLGAVDLLNSSDGSQNWGNDSLGTDDGGGASVNDTVGLAVHLKVSDLDFVKLDQPVGFLLQVVVGEVAGEVVRVDAAEDESRAVLLGTFLSQVEGEGLVGDEALADHLVEDSWDVVHGDGAPGHTQDTVEVSDTEVEGQVSHFAEDEVSHSESSDLDLVVGQETGDGARAVLDLEFSAVGLVRGGLGAVVLVVWEASEDLALLGWDPEVGRTGVEDDGELLVVGTEGDRSVVLGVLEVDDWHFASFDESHGVSSVVHVKPLSVSVLDFGDWDLHVGES